MIEIQKYTSPRCKYCPAVSHYVDELRDTGKLDGIHITHFNALNLSEEERDKLGIHAVPVLLFKRNGLEITRINGMTDQETILDAVQIARDGR